MGTYSAGVIRKCKKSKTSDKWEWQGVLFYTPDDGSKQKTKTKMLGVECIPPTAEETKKGRNAAPTGKGSREALARLNAWRDELIAKEQTQEKESFTPNGNVHVPDYVLLYWRTCDINSKTVKEYNSYHKRMNRPVLDIPIKNLTTPIVRTWLAELKEEGVSQWMQHKTFNQLQYACNWAVENEDLLRNPCLKSDRPKRPKTEKNYLDEAGLTLMWDKLAELRPNEPVLAEAASLALCTGMREGELCALTWDDIDNQYIHVRNAVTQEREVKPYPKPGKRRRIPINNSIRAILDRLRKRSLNYVKKLDGVYLFASSTEPTTVPSPDYLGKQWRIFSRMCGVKGVTGRPVTFHDLRKTFSTVAVENNIAVTVLSDIVGHEDASTTLRYYAGTTDAKKREGMETMDEAIGGETTS